MKRKKTILEMDMPDGKTYAFSARELATKRALYYAKLDVQRGDVEPGMLAEAFEEELQFALTDEYELGDYIVGNMNWDDMLPFVMAVYPTEKKAVTREEMNIAWLNTIKRWLYED